MAKWEYGDTNWPTIRKWLDEVNFDWDKGQVLVWEVDEDNYILKNSLPTINNNHPLLDLEFDNGFGGANCPPFIAYDRNVIYSVDECDGSTYLMSINSDPEVYLKGLLPFYTGRG